MSAWLAVRAGVAIAVVAVAGPLATLSSAAAAASWPPAPGEAVDFQRVPAGAGVLYSRPVGDRCPLGFALGYVWDRSDPVDAELSGRYTVDDFGNSRFFSNTVGDRVTMVTPVGRLVRSKVLLHKGDRVCRRTDPQGNKPIADPAGTIMGLPAGFPAHPTVADVQALGLSTATRTVPTFQVSRPAVPRSRAQLPTSITLDSIQSVKFVSEVPHAPVPGDARQAPYGFSPDRLYDVVYAYRLDGGSGLWKMEPIISGWGRDVPDYQAFRDDWITATGFQAPRPGGGLRFCCDVPFDSIELPPGRPGKLTLGSRVVVTGSPLLADGTIAPGAVIGASATLGTQARGVADDFGQQYLPLSATWGWSIGEDFGKFDPKVNTGCHPATTGASSCNYTPTYTTVQDPAAIGTVWIAVPR